MTIQMQGETLSGKQRELLQRDELFFETARRIFLDEGYHELTISRLAEATGFSRATLYDRFGSKEGLLVEVGIECQEELHGILQRASRFPGTPRERMMAVGEALRVYSARYSDNMRIVATISDEAIAKRVSDAQQARMRELDADMFRTLLEIIREATDKGDITFPEGLRGESLCFALWTMIDGCAAAMRGSAPLEEIGIADPIGDLLPSTHRLLDGYGWRPLLSEWDYEASMERICRFLDKALPTDARASSKAG